jgi:hypothetical protein
VVEESILRPMLFVALLVVFVLVLTGTVIEVMKGGGGEPKRSITEHTGTIYWKPKGGDPEPRLASRYWTEVYPAAYASRVRPGVGVYVKEERIGSVRARRVDRGSVWVYAQISPAYARIAASATETEPIETPDGPRVEIFRYSAPGPTA